MSDTATLLIHCPDRPGLVHDVTGFISSHQGNIIDLQQHIDPDQDAFFMRLEWSLENFTLEKEEIEARLQPMARRHNMQMRLSFASQRKRIALFVTKENHCLYDLLARHEAGELPVDIPVIVSNHETLKPAAERFGIPFRHFAITKDNKAAQEQAMIALLKQERIDTVVLAKYMQIIGSAMIAEFPNRILNIHHSFLPAFVGAKPYHQAFQRGVKIIGATSHYVTADLDEGPIIHQDVMRVSHEDTVNDLVRLGRDLEKTVLAKALWWHVRDRVLVFKNKTVVFD
ncbi:MAG: formyltetrahydrofolate deformylase [Prosthecobacter sp.]|uniref:formyltetrahydrofolate deformylase n=1 Tax=Prosthecobacter sp. TaxID=1965333 RepID=UPI0019EC2892|nr:formyltetrahydrofolate deformylase [Prosthecobacter sp.]MBE2282317.1 formyltetrahydrofolate deformylase [Prosthecobacter sp.]